MSAKGRNVWFELLSNDVEGSTSFYTEVLGWKARSWEDADPNMPYTMFVLGESPIGGLMQIPEDAQKMGAPPQWLAYTSVDDVDAVAQRTKKLGGSIHRAPFDIPKVGRLAILADPQGATFAVCKTETEMETPPEGPGVFSWAELNTTDWESAWKFYKDLFGWQEKSKMDMGPGGTYFMFQHADASTKGGMSNMAKQMNLPPHWLYYVTVEDIDETIRRIDQNGGKVMNGPMDIPGNDVIAQCEDPQGALFAIYAKKKR